MDDKESVKKDQKNIKKERNVQNLEIVKIRLSSTLNPWEFKLEPYYDRTSRLKKIRDSKIEEIVNEKHQNSTHK
jgi:hypothetical protein